MRRGFLCVQSCYGAAQLGLTAIRCDPCLGVGLGEDNPDHALASFIHDLHLEPLLSPIGFI
jgi:hypothetical protein